MANGDLSEMEQMQRMSETYQPNLPGPLVGDKMPMSRLVEEYAQADPAYVVKTQALAITHSGYRAIKGDGQCGWRGAAFGYFETLAHLGNIQMLQQEEDRIRSLGQMVQDMGIDYQFLLELFDHTWALFGDLRRAIERAHDVEALLTSTFNSEEKSSYIIYHFRIITSAFVEAHSNNFQNFLGMSISDYRRNHIEPVGQEIDQVGLQALTDAIIAPAGFALEVLYLDRSVGSEVTPHEFAPKNSGNPTICLLYRPGHYDIIYRATPAVQVYLQAHHHLVADNMCMYEPSTLPSEFHDVLFAAPRSTTANSRSTFEFGGRDGSDTMLQHAPQQQPFMQPNGGTYMLPGQYAGVGAPYSSYHPQIAYPQQHSSPSTSTNTTYTVSSAAISPSPHSPTSSSSTNNNTSTPPVALPVVQSAGSSEKGPAIRLTQYVRQYEQVGESVPLSTGAFGNAASLSPAHFRNQEFQPQMWKVEDEYLKQ